MPPNKEDFLKLAALQDADKRRDDLRRRIAAVPEEIAVLRAEIEAEKEKLASVHAKANAVQAKKKDIETTVLQKEGAIRKHQGDLNQVKTNDAFKALLKAIEDEKKAIGELETEILLLMDEVDSVKKEEGEIKKEIDGFVQKRNSSIAELEGRKKALEDELFAAEQGRTESLASLPAELSDLYEKTRARRAGIAVSRLKETNCSECRMAQPPQSILNVVKGTKIITCDSCQRILIPMEAAAA